MEPTASEGVAVDGTGVGVAAGRTGMGVDVGERGMGIASDSGVSKACIAWDPLPHPTKNKTTNVRPNISERDFRQFMVCTSFYWGDPTVERLHAMVKGR
jgi:hypothetical protein